MGGEVREKIEGHQYASIVPSSMGATVTSWVENTNQMSECISSLHIKSVKYNATMSLNKSILKKS